MNSPRAATSSAVFCRLRSELRLKLILTVVLNICIFVPYHFLQWHHFFPATAMPASFCDRLIPFSDQAVWIYLSVYLLMPIGPFLMNNRPQIFRYAFGVILIGTVADFIFFIWPTSCPRPAADGTNAVYRMLIGVDNPFDAFPSLHAAFAVFSALCAGRVLREFRGGAPWRGGLWLWVSLILFATLATKQHMAADIGAGTVLAFGVYIVLFHQSNAIPEPAMLISTVTTDSDQQNSTAL